jgi:hypothetical protein
MPPEAPDKILARLERVEAAIAGIEHTSLQPNEADHEKWLDEIVSLPEGASLRKVSVDTLKREGKTGRVKIIELSERRRGITRREALKPR